MCLLLELLELIGELLDDILHLFHFLGMGELVRVLGQYLLQLDDPVLILLVFQLNFLHLPLKLLYPPLAIVVVLNGYIGLL